MTELWQDVCRAMAPEGGIASRRRTGLKSTLYPLAMSSRPSALRPSLFPRLLALTVLHFGALAAMLLSGRWIREMGGSEAVLGWFSASIVPGIVLGAPLAGRLASRFSERRLILVGAFLVGVTALAFAAFDAVSFWLAPLRFLQGLGHGVVFTCLLSLGAHAVPDAHKARGIGYIALCAQLGNVTGVAVAEGLLAQGFPFIFAAAGALAGLTWLTALTLPDTLSHSPDPAGDAPAAFVPSRGQAALAIAFFAVLGGSYGTVLQVIPLLVQDIAAASGKAAHASPVMVAIFCTVAFCRLALARLADGRHRQPVLVGSTLLLISATACWPATSSVTEMVAVGVAFAVGYGLLFPGLNGLVLTQVAGRWRSRASGWIVMAYDGGFFGLLLGLGPLAARWGYGAMFWTLCLLQLTGALLFLVMVRRIARRQRASDRAGTRC